MSRRTFQLVMHGFQSLIGVGVGPLLRARTEHDDYGQQ